MAINHQNGLTLPAGLDPQRLPSHIAIIMDGNGRWATQRGLPRFAGHRQGVRALKELLRCCKDWGIATLTAYAFSTENWQRPRAEVEGLMAMFAERIDRETPELDEEGVRMRFIGRRETVGPELAERMDWAEKTTAGNERIVIVERDQYDRIAAFCDEVEAVIEELAKKREPRVERRREAFIDRRVRANIVGSSIARPTAIGHLRRNRRARPARRAGRQRCDGASYDERETCNDEHAARVTRDANSVIGAWTCGARSEA